jgi:hypothetical protein
VLFIVAVLNSTGLTSQSYVFTEHGAIMVANVRPALLLPGEPWLQKHCRHHPGQQEIWFRNARGD